MNRSNPFALLGILLLAACKPDSNITEVPHEGNRWEWVYSIDESNTDTLSSITTSPHKAIIERSDRKKSERPISYRFYLDNTLVETFHVYKREYIYANPQNHMSGDLIGSRNYIKNSGAWDLYYASINSTGFIGFYIHDFPYDEIDGRKVKNYFKLI